MSIKEHCADLAQSAIMGSYEDCRESILAIAKEVGATAIERSFDNVDIAMQAVALSRLESGVDDFDTIFGIIANKLDLDVEYPALDPNEEAVIADIT